VEAVQQTIYLDVIRTFGAVGVVSVDVITQSGSAVGQTGPNMYLSAFQQVSHDMVFFFDDFCLSDTSAGEAAVVGWV
jgi:hypothetical protein